MLVLITKLLIGTYKSGDKIDHKFRTSGDHVKRTCIERMNSIISFIDSKLRCYNFCCIVIDQLRNLNNIKAKS